MLFDVASGATRKELATLAAEYGIDQAATLPADELLNLLKHAWTRDVLHQYQITGRPPEGSEHGFLLELGLIEEVNAPPGEYAGALLLGATRPAVVKRLSHLAKAFHAGAQFLGVWSLGGARELNTTTESDQALNTPAELAFRKGWVPYPLNERVESAMMHYTFEQSQLPSAWEEVFTHTPKQPKVEGGMRDPNTEDTLRTALARGLEPGGRYVLVSSQPYVRRQTLNARRVFGDQLDFEPIDIEPIGYRAPEGMPLKSYLDELRNLLQEELLSVKRPDGSYPWS